VRTSAAARAIQDPRRRRVAGERQGAVVPPSGGIGTSGAKYEGLELALGDRAYIDDLRVPGMLHAAFHLAAYARADVLDLERLCQGRAGVERS